jgi:hypothetical protein
VTWLPADSPRPRAAALAAAVAIALAAGIALIATSTGGRAHTRPAHAKPATPATPATHAKPATPATAATPALPAHTNATAPTVFPHTPTGAVSAATAWLQDAAQSLYNGTWATTMSSLATPALEARMRPGNSGAATLYRRVTAPNAPPLAVRAWPLGYAVQQYSSTSARVRVWQLFVLELARPMNVVGYTSTTVLLQWMEGSWKTAGVLHGPDLTPPGRNATATQITDWIDAVDQLHGYSYAP